MRIKEHIPSICCIIKVRTQSEACLNIASVYTGSPAVDPPTTEPPDTDRPTIDTPGSKSPPIEPSTMDTPDLKASESIPPVQGTKVKLPKISLLRFNVDPVKWTSFCDLYQSVIHLNSELSEVDKFNYLRSLLDHTAFNAIAGLTLSSTN